MAHFKSLNVIFERVFSSEHCAVIIDGLDECHDSFDQESRYEVILRILLDEMFVRRDILRDGFAKICAKNSIPSHVERPKVDNGGPPSLTINRHPKKGRKKNDGLSCRTYRFDKCHVYMNSFNARGVRFKNSGNYAPRITRLSCFSLIFFM